MVPFLASAIISNFRVLDQSMSPSVFLYSRYDDHILNKKTDMTLRLQFISLHGNMRVKSQMK